MYVSTCAAPTLSRFTTHLFAVQLVFRDPTQDVLLFQGCLGHMSHSCSQPNPTPHFWGAGLLVPSKDEDLEFVIARVQGIGEKCPAHRRQDWVPATLSSA